MQAPGVNAPALEEASRYPWIRLLGPSAENGTLVLSCERCGATSGARLPMPLSVWLLAARAFGQHHRECPPRPAAA